MRRVRILTPVFFARFFDNEMAAGAGSLKTPFFWMVAFLAAPGVFMPVLMSFAWGLTAQVRGLETLAVHVRADKVLYLGYTACAAGLVMTTAWNALLLDRRDGLVLGAQPVSGRDVVIAKLIALFAYFGLLMTAMHAGSSLVFGVSLPNTHTFGLVTAIVAHFVASGAYGLFICLCAVSVQGLALIVAGGRGHAKLSPLLQLLTTAVVLVSFFAIGDVSTSTVDTIAGSGSRQAPWILSTPTLWFLGLYEVIVGFRDPIFVSLAWRAVAALGIVAVIAAVSMPLSYRRLMVDAVEQSPKTRRLGLVNRMTHAMARAISLDGPTRAIADFFLITIVRHTRPRLPVALALGTTAAWAFSVAGVALKDGVPDTPSAPLFGVPLAAMFFLIVGFRVAASLPSEIPPRWVFGVLGVSDRTARRGVRRVVLLCAVAVPTFISAVVFYRWWPQAALPHALLCLTVGFLMVELAFRRFEGVPCARIFHPDGANIRTWWPVYLAAFVFVSSVLPAVGLSLRSNAPALWALIAAPVAAAFAVRIANSRMVHVPTPDDDELPQVQVLDI